MTPEEQAYHDAYWDWYVNADTDDNGSLHRKMDAAKAELDRSRKRE